MLVNLRVLSITEVELSQLHCAHSARVARQDFFFLKKALEDMGISPWKVHIELGTESNSRCAWFSCTSFEIYHTGAVLNVPLTARLAISYH